MRRTRTLEEPPVKRPLAAGLRVSTTRVLHLFKDMGETVTIGAGLDCDIRLDSVYISTVHAELEYRDGGMWIENRSRHGTTFIDGWPIGEKSVALLVGMTIQLARTELSATDEHGRIAVLANTPSELSSKASTQYGSDRLASEHLGYSHSTIGRHVRRYKARKVSEKEARSQAPRDAKRQETDR